MSHQRAAGSGIPPRAFWTMLRNEIRLAFRNPRGLIVGLVLPIVLMVVFGSRTKFQTPQARYGGLSLFDVYLPILYVFAVSAISLINLPNPLATYREHGILRRLSTTPLPTTWVLLAQLAINVAVAAVALLLLVLISHFGFGFASPQNAVGFVVTALLALAAMCALGFVVAALAPTGSSAYLIGAFVFVVLMFFAGLWLPRIWMPAFLLDISNYTPLGATVQSFTSALGGAFPPGWALLTLAAWAVAGTLAAVRIFRWD